MKTMMFACAIALAAAACTHAADQAPAVAQVDGEQHVVVRAEAGRIWWQHRAWTEPHELWALPSEGKVENLNVERSATGYVVSFDQGGQAWSGNFGETQQRKATQLAKREQ
jgi:opacity protein-like surface antigen